METISAVALNAMQLGIERVNVASMNIVNSQTVAYKKSLVSAKSFANHLTASGMNISMENPSVQNHIDRSPSSLKFTGRSLDLAIAGGGFFEVMTPRGPAYTRRGDFMTDAQGRLTTSNGHPVMGAQGEIIFIKDAAVKILADGRIQESLNPSSSGGTPAPSSFIERLRLVDVEQGAHLQRTEDGLFMVDPVQVFEVNGSEVTVQQGFLENSNVNLPTEMIQLMQSLRHFESMQKIAVGYDEVVGNVIRRLGEGS